MGGKGCNLEETVAKKRLSKKPYCFVALPDSKLFVDTEKAIRAVVKGGNVFNQKYEAKKLNGKNINVILAKKERFVGQGMCKICQLCWFSDFAIAELGMLRPNVMIEIGWLMGFQKKIILTLHKAHMSLKEIPFDLGNPMLVTYSGITDLSYELDDKINFLLLTSLKKKH